MVKLNGTGRTCSSIGRSFSVSCSCRLMVCVEMTAFFLLATANRIAGTRYARLLPTPVPASTAKCSPLARACATATAISCCWGRNSKFFDCERTPFGEKIAATCWTRSRAEPEGWDSTVLIIGYADRRDGCGPYLGRRTTTSWAAWFFTILERPVAPRARRTALISASVPDETNRTC